MHLEAVGDNWKLKIKLRRESELEERWNHLKSKMMTSSGSEEDA